MFPRVLRSLVGLIAALAGVGAIAADEVVRPNILVIMADDLGFSDIGPFGSEISTPALDQLAREGRLMSSVHVPSMPDIAHAEFLFGVDHHTTVPRHPLGPIKTIQPETAGKLVSIAQVLRGAGYRTHMVGTWDSGTDSSLYPSAQGFDTSHALLRMAGDYFPPDNQGPLIPGARITYLDNGEPAPYPAEYITDFWTDRLVADILGGKGTGKPFFAYAAYTSPHFPLHAPDSFMAKQRGKYDLGYDAIRFARIARQRASALFPHVFEPAAAVPEAMGFKKWESLTPEERRFEARRMEVYAAMVENLDWNIGRLVGELKANGLYDNTLIVFTASSTGAQTAVSHASTEGLDNSIDNIGRKNSWISYSERWAEVSNAPFSRWKAKATEGGTVVPLIVRLPGQTERAGNSDAMALMRDLAPTLMDYAGVSAKSRTVPYTGVSLRPVWEGKAQAAYPADHVFADEYRDEAYVRKGPWKAVRISDFAVNAYDGSDAMVIEYMAALKRGDTAKANAIRADRPLRWTLFNIEQDRGETDDLAARHPEILADLVKLYNQYAERNGIPLEPRE